MSDPRFTNEPSPEVLAYWRGKGIQPSFDWRDVWAHEHAFAFTVAKATQIEVLRTIQQAVDEAIVKGIPFEQFVKDLEPRLQALGWWGRQVTVDPKTGEPIVAQLGSPHRLRIIYDANIRTATAAGLWARMWRTRDILPFLIYQETTSAEPREEHLEWAQTPVVLPIEDPWWDTHYPPNGWQCKCWVLQVDEQDARAAGWSPGTAAPDLEVYEWFNARTGERALVPRGIDPGWATNPGKTRQKVAEDWYSGRVADLDPEMKAAVQKDMVSNWLFRKLVKGELDQAGPEIASKAAVPVGIAAPELVGAAGSTNALAWLTPEVNAAIGGKALTEAQWLAVARALDEGAVVRVPAEGAQPKGFLDHFKAKPKDWFTVYRLIDGEYWRVDLAMRDRLIDGQPIKGGARLAIEGIERVDPHIARLAIHDARRAGRLVKEEAGTVRRPLPPPVPPEAGEKPEDGGDPKLAPKGRNRAQRPGRKRTSRKSRTATIR